jgi:hypothetical protein
MMIEQRHMHDCAVCCFAMLSGWQYEDVVALIGDCYHPKRGHSYTRFDVRFPDLDKIKEELLK